MSPIEELPVECIQEIFWSMEWKEQLRFSYTSTKINDAGIAVRYRRADLVWLLSAFPNVEVQAIEYHSWDLPDEIKYTVRDLDEKEGTKRALQGWTDRVLAIHELFVHHKIVELVDPKGLVQLHLPSNLKGAMGLQINGAIVGMDLTPFGGLRTVRVDLYFLGTRSQLKPMVKLLERIAESSAEWGHKLRDLFVNSCRVSASRVIADLPWEAFEGLEAVGMSDCGDALQRLRRLPELTQVSLYPSPHTFDELGKEPLAQGDFPKTTHLEGTLRTIRPLLELRGQQLNVLKLVANERVRRYWIDWETLFEVLRLAPALSELETVLGGGSDMLEMPRMEHLRRLEVTATYGVRLSSQTLLNLCNAAPKLTSIVWDCCGGFAPAISRERPPCIDTLYRMTRDRRWQLIGIPVAAYWRVPSMKNRQTQGTEQWRCDNWFITPPQSVASGTANHQRLDLLETKKLTKETWYGLYARGAPIDEYLLSVNPHLHDVKGVALKQIQESQQIMSPPTCSAS